MNFAVVIAALIAITLAMVLFAVYCGGGIAAMRRQGPLLLILAAALIGIGLVFLFASGSRDTLLPLGAVIAAASATIASIQVASLAKRHAPGFVLVTMWLVVLVLAVAALGAAALWLTG